MTRDDPSDFGIVRYWYTTFSPFPMKPNVHEYPEHATERELLQYKIAVEQAALDGQPIEVKPRFPSRSADGWRQVHTAPDDLPSFNWCTMYYRVARPKIAEGHNPAGVTEDQIPAGWRLFSLEEYQHLAPTDWVDDTRFWDKSEWTGVGRWRITVSDGTLITQKYAGFYLPKPVQPTTVLGWLNMLPAGYRERALKNRRPDDDDLACSDLRIAVLRLPWLGSPEGTQFWSDVYEAVTRGDAFPPLPDAPKKLVPWSLDNFVWPDCVRRRMAGGKVFGVQLATEDGLYIGVHDSTCIGKDHQPIDWKELAEDFEYSVDNGRTWQPCCREEVAS